MQLQEVIIVDLCARCRYPGLGHSICYHLILIYVTSKGEITNNFLIHFGLCIINKVTLYMGHDLLIGLKKSLLKQNNYDLLMKYNI